MGLRGNLPIFIGNFLTDRTFQIHLGTILSDEFNQEEGVPQGAILSTTLFNVKSRLVFDTAIHKPAITRGETCDCGTNVKLFPVDLSDMVYTPCCTYISYGIQGAPTKTDCQAVNEYILRNRRWQLISGQSKTCKSHATISWNTFLGEFIRVWSRFWFEFGNPWDIPTRKQQSVCLWCKSCASPGWGHNNSLFHRHSLSQRRGQLPAASAQWYPGHTFRDSRSVPSCCGAS